MKKLSIFWVSVLIFILIISKALLKQGAYSVENSNMEFNEFMDTLLVKVDSIIVLNQLDAPQNSSTQRHDKMGYIVELTLKFIESDSSLSKTLESFAPEQKLILDRKIRQRLLSKLQERDSLLNNK